MGVNDEISADLKSFKSLVMMCLQFAFKALKYCKPSSKSDTARHRRNHFYGGRMMGYYATASAFSRSSQIHQNIDNSRTTMARPSGGRSGFFHSSSHSSHSS